METGTKVLVDEVPGKAKDPISERLDLLCLMFWGTLSCIRSSNPSVLCTVVRKTTVHTIVLYLFRSCLHAVQFLFFRISLPIRCVTYIEITKLI